MSSLSKLCIILLRVAVGWYLFYIGLAAFLQKGWTILPYIQNAGTFNSFYTVLTDPTYITSLSFLIKGLLVVCGALIMLGLFVQIMAPIGFLIMMFLYFPTLDFPRAGNNFYIVNDYLLVAITALYLYAVRAGDFFGLGSMFRFSRY